MNSREVEEKNIWEAYLAENTSAMAGLNPPDANELAAYLDRVSEDEAAEKMEYYLANSAAGLRTMRDMRAILEDRDEEPSIMPAHIMGRAHAAVRAAIAVTSEVDSRAVFTTPASASSASRLAFLKRVLGLGSSAADSRGGRRGLWSGLIWAAAILLMSFVGYFGFTIGEQTGDEGRTARTEKEISRPDLLFPGESGNRTPDLMPVGYELGVAE